jgi:hypothetical protein
MARRDAARGITRARCSALACVASPDNVQRFQTDRALQGGSGSARNIRRDNKLARLEVSQSLVRSNESIRMSKPRRHRAFIGCVRLEYQSNARASSLCGRCNTRSSARHIMDFNNGLRHAVSSPVKVSQLQAAFEMRTYRSKNKQLNSLRVHWV